jgi:hypothetical protein
MVVLYGSYEQEVGVAGPGGGVVPGPWGCGEWCCAIAPDWLSPFRTSKEAGCAEWRSAGRPGIHNSSLVYMLLHQ